MADTIFRSQICCTDGILDGFLVMVLVTPDEEAFPSVAAVSEKKPERPPDKPTTSANKVGHIYTQE